MTIKDNSGTTLSVALYERFISDVAVADLEFISQEEEGSPSMTRTLVFTLHSLIGVRLNGVLGVGSVLTPCFEGDTSFGISTRSFEPTGIDQL